MTRHATAVDTRTTPDDYTPELKLDVPRAPADEMCIALATRGHINHMTMHQLVDYTSKASFDVARALADEMSIATAEDTITT